MQPGGVASNFLQVRRRNGKVIKQTSLQNNRTVTNAKQVLEPMLELENT